MADESGKNQHPHQKGVPATAQRRHFRIQLHGQVDQRWMISFEPISYSIFDEVTVIEVLTDQAGLRGILNRLWDLNLDVFSVAEIESSAIQNGGK